MLAIRDFPRHCGNYGACCGYYDGRGPEPGRAWRLGEDTFSVRRDAKREAAGCSDLATNRSGTRLTVSATDSTEKPMPTTPGHHPVEPDTPDQKEPLHHPHKQDHPGPDDADEEWDEDEKDSCAEPWWM